MIINSEIFGLLLGLILGFLAMLIFYLFVSAENRRYAKKQKEMIENLAKLLEEIERRRV